VAPLLRVDLEMFSRGGLAILDAIESSGYDTLRKRPSLSKWTQAKLLGRTLVNKTFARKEKRESGQFSATRVRAVVSPLRSDVGTMGAAMGSAFAGLPVKTRSGPYPADVRESYAECNRIAKASKSSFYLAFFGLPKEKRNALCALYAFMRLIDDVSDEAGDLESKRQGLARWRAMLDEAVDGRTSAHPVLPALADTIARFGIPVRYFHDLILGAEMDLTIANYATFDRLAEYCYRVAGTVGLTCIHVFGFADPKSPDLAERLGLAFQLTNIIRDVGTDHSIGRVYLPQQDIDRFNISQNDLAGPITPKIRELLEFEADRAWQLYAEGAPLVHRVDADSRATLWALIRTYSTLLARIEERGFDVFSSRISLSSAEKVQYLLMAGMKGWSKKDALAKRSGDRRRSGGPFVRRRTG
jgi:phytoene synthase